MTPAPAMRSLIAARRRHPAARRLRRRHRRGVRRPTPPSTAATGHRRRRRSTRRRRRGLRRGQDPRPTARSPSPPATRPSRRTSSTTPRPRTARASRPPSRWPSPSELGFEGDAVTWVRTSFDAAIAARPEGLRLQPAAVHDHRRARRGRRASATRYYTAAQAIFGYADSPGRRRRHVDRRPEGLKLGAAAGTTSLDYITETSSSPTPSRSVFNDNAAAKAALDVEADRRHRHRPADRAVHHRGRDRGHQGVRPVPDRQRHGDQFGLLFAKDNPLVECVEHRAGQPEGERRARRRSPRPGCRSTPRPRHHRELITARSPSRRPATRCSRRRDRRPTRERRHHVLAAPSRARPGSGAGARWSLGVDRARRRAIILVVPLAPGWDRRCSASFFDGDTFRDVVPRSCSGPSGTTCSIFLQLCAVHRGGRHARRGRPQRPLARAVPAAAVRHASTPTSSAACRSSSGSP